MATTGTSDPNSAIIKAGEDYQAKMKSMVAGMGLSGTVIGDWIAAGGNPLNEFKLVGTWLFGRKYTGGDYALGEIFLNRVLNKETNNRWDTPDAVIPIAWVYFTTLLGIPINVNTDIDGLGDKTLEGYLSGRPEQRGHVTQAQIDRANMLVNRLGGTSDKYKQWPPSAFGLVPYVAPIPDPHIVGGLYNGPLPNGQKIVNGLPASGTNATKGSNIKISGTSGSSGSSFVTDLLLYIGLAIAVIILIVLIAKTSKNG